MICCAAGAGRHGCAMRLLDPVTPLAVTLDWGEGRRLPVGRLAFDRGRALFEADSAYLASGLDLSAGSYPPRPGIIRAQTDRFDGLHGIFADSLPDSWGRLLLNRRAARHGITPARLTPLDRLAGIGDLAIGALTFRPAMEPESPPDGGIDLPTLARDALHLLAGEEAPSLALLQRLGGSPGGARPKVLVGLDGAGALVHGEQALPPGFTHWIVKFPAGEDMEDIGPVEAAYMEMARQAGLRVPDFKLIAASDGPGFFAARRFDREGAARIHVQSLCAVLEAPPGLTLVGYRELLLATRQVTRDAGEVKEAFRRATFNLLAHNRDDHAKQHSFIMDQGGRWRLSPVYDLTFASGPGGEHQMDFAGEARQPGPADLNRLADLADVPRPFVRQVVQQVLDITAHWPAIAEAAGVTKTSAAQIAAGLERVALPFRKG